MNATRLTAVLAVALLAAAAAAGSGWWVLEPTWGLPLLAAAGATATLHPRRRRTLTRTFDLPGWSPESLDHQGSTPAPVPDLAGGAVADGVHRVLGDEDECAGTDPGDGPSAHEALPGYGVRTPPRGDAGGTWRCLPSLPCAPPPPPAPTTASRPSGTA